MTKVTKGSHLVTQFRPTGLPSFYTRIIYSMTVSYISNKHLVEQVFSYLTTKSRYPFLKIDMT